MAWADYTTSDSGKGHEARRMFSFQIINRRRVCCQPIVRRLPRGSAATGEYLPPQPKSSLEDKKSIHLRGPLRMNDNFCLKMKKPFHVHQAMPCGPIGIVRTALFSFIQNSPEIRKPYEATTTLPSHCRLCPGIQLIANIRSDAPDRPGYRERRNGGPVWQRSVLGPGGKLLESRLQQQLRSGQIL